ncbi:MAG: hypothetical protein PF638_07580 [Candidatus Delongbacteria bacterium]|jgi:hypothetical protein|nr:hypothetical protein [Candidatus Delongbacteria bacterium]
MENVRDVSIFVSCPGDVESEKREIITICNTITKSNVGYDGIRFYVKDWRDHVGHYNARNQAQVNEFIGKYDIYIGLWWKRMGSAPGSINSSTGEPNESGSEEEFDIALNENEKSNAPKIYLFFKNYNLEVNPDNMNKEAEQLLKLSKFIDKIKEPKTLNWINKFTSIEQFREKISNLILITQNELRNAETPIVEIEPFEEEIKEELLDKSFKIAKKAAFIFVLFNDTLNLTEFEQLVDKNELGCLLSMDYLNCDDNKLVFNKNKKDYFVAKILVDLEFDDIKKYLFTENKYANPQLIRVVSYIYQLLKSDNKLLEEITKYLCEHNQLPLIKLDKDKISIKTRELIFKHIFNDFKKKDIWIYSNSYHNEEVAEFGESLETYKYLISELQTPTNSKIVFINSLILLGYFKNLNDEQKEQIIPILFEKLGSNIEDKNIVQNVITVFKRQEITSGDIFEKIFNYIKEYKNEYVRTSVYRFLSKTDYVDKYFKYLIDGLRILKTKGDPDREDINLIDEDVSLHNSLLLLKESKSIKELLKHFFADYSSRNMIYFDELIKSIIQKSIDIYNNDTSIFENILDVYLKKGMEYGHKNLKELISFFEKTGTKTEALELIITQETLNIYTQYDFICELLDNSNFNIIIDKYNTKLNEGHIKLIYHNLLRINESISEEFKEQIKDKLDIELIKPVVKDYDSIKKIKQQGEFDLLFDNQELKQITLEFFEKYEVDDIYKNDVFKAQKDYWNNFEFEKSNCDLVTNLLNMFADINGRINKHIVSDWFEVEEKVNKYIINKIYKQLLSFKDLSLNHNHMKFINDWCIAKLKDINFKKSLIQGDAQVHYNEFAIYLWYFYKKLHIEFPREVLLDMLSFDYVVGTEFAGIDDLVSKLPLDLVKERIRSNLREGISVFVVLMNHFKIVINNEMQEEYHYIFDEIKLNRLPDYEIKNLVDMYYEATEDYIGLFKLLKSSSSINWGIVDKLITFKNEIPLAEFLVKVLEEAKDRNLRLKAAHYLIKLQEIKGIEYFIHYINQDDINQLQLDVTDCFKSIENYIFIPKLFELLEMSYRKIIKIEPFYTLDKIITGALHTMALKEESFYTNIRERYIKFIESKKEKYPDVKYLSYQIDEMDKRFRETHIKVPSIEEVKEIIKELGL